MVSFEKVPPVMALTVNVVVPPELFVVVTTLLVTVIPVTISFLYLISPLPSITRKFCSDE